MKLIINADDYGITKGASKAIRDLANEGVITSTTVMVNLASKGDLKKLKEVAKKISIGLHFVLDVGKSAAKNKELTDSKGYFKYGNQFDSDEIQNNVSKEAIYEELEAQFKKLSKYIKVSHIDSHHHLHLRVKKINEVVREFAKKHKLKTRENKNKKGKGWISYGKNLLIDEFYDQGIYKIEPILRNLDSKQETVDLMCHPAYVTKKLLRITSYNLKRGEEINELRKIKTYLSKSKLIKY